MTSPSQKLPKSILNFYWVDLGVESDNQCAHWERSTSLDFCNM